MNLNSAATIAILGGLIAASVVTNFDVEVTFPSEESTPVEEFQEETILVGDEETTSI